MTIFPFIIDARPDFLGQRGGSRSLLLTPFGGGTLLDWISRELRPLTAEAPTIAPSFAVDDEYLHALHGQATHIARVVAERTRSLFENLEPSDLLLILDPQCLILDPDELRRIARDSRGTRAARYQLALDRSHQGTREFLQFDNEGRVRRIQRYYEGHTWVQTQAVASALVPVTSMWDAADAGITDLPRLRRALTASGALGQDLPIDAPTADLTTEHGWLAAIETTLQAIRPAALGDSFNELAPNVCVAKGASVAPTARLYGPVIVQRGAVVEDNAVIIGPTIVGPAARVGKGSTLAKCIVANEAIVEPGSVANQRVLFGTVGGQFLPARYDLQDAPPSAGPTRIDSLLTDSQRRDDARRRRYLRAKLILDRIVAAVALLLLSPLFLIVGLLVKATSRGPAFFGHDREGLDGQPFKCWKFRTMVQNAQQQERKLAGKSNEVDGPQFKLTNDPRVTTLGKFLRGSNIDELPQLLNVLRGEMALIGPRPSPFRENQICVPWRRARLSVRPGISGLWQICRHDRESGDFHQWIYYDILYARNLSFWLDTKILLATVLTGGGRRSVSLGWILPREKVANAYVGGASAFRMIADSKVTAAPLTVMPTGSRTA